MIRYFVESIGTKRKVKPVKRSLISLVCCIFVVLGSLLVLPAENIAHPCKSDAPAQHKDRIAEKLFNLKPGQADALTNHDYNDYLCHPNKKPMKDGYDGGHAGWDVQTKNVALIATENVPFYSLTEGTVIKVKEGDLYNTSIIAVRSDRDADGTSRKMTTLYLHARRVLVSEGQKVQVGTCLGIQGNTGLWPRDIKTLPTEEYQKAKQYDELDLEHSYNEHVHIEVREGEWPLASYGAGASRQTVNKNIDPIVYLYPWAEQLPAADVNRDGQVDLADAILVVENLGRKTPQAADINDDGIINITDLAEIVTYLEGYLRNLISCAVAPATPIRNRFRHATTTRTDQVSVENMIISQETAQQWLDIIRKADDGSLVFKHTVAMLENLLHPVIPKKTALFANYPNPFNPETWIPYYLADETDVTITIYDAAGGLVRQLDVGHRKTGYYTNQNRAAYWDGKSESGERVASGVYFYTLTTDRHTATRKMVILK